MFYKINSRNLRFLLSFVPLNKSGQKSTLIVKFRLIKIQLGCNV